MSVSRVQKIGNDVGTEFDRKRDVSYYVLEGEAECMIGGVKRVLKKGDCVFYSKGLNPKRLRGAILLEISFPPLNRDKRFETEGSKKYECWSLVLFAIAIVFNSFYFSVVCGPTENCVVWFLKMCATLIV